jgi:uncharacterized protein (TIGR00297 family)
MPIILRFALLGLILAAAVIISLKTGKLTPRGGLAGSLVAMMIFIGAGYAGLFMLAAFFVFGTAATGWRKTEKQAFKSPAGEPVKRNSGQVLANGGAAAVAGLLVYFMPSHGGLFRLMMGASLSSAMADTLSSELGMIYGRRFYNIISFKTEKKGLDGVISLEGTLIGLLGSVLIAVIYAAGFGWNKDFAVIIIAGTAGNLADSVFGALFERKHYLDNDAVNFLNTLVAALTAGIFALIY